MLEIHVAEKEVLSWYFTVMQAGQAELVSLEKVLKEAMVPAGTAREVMRISVPPPPPLSGPFCLFLSFFFLL